MTAIQPGVKVHAQARDGQLLERTAMTGVIDGDDFPVVWVCRDEEWDVSQREGREPEGLPWPVDSVRVLESVA
jgi:hypothetical protein